MICEGMTATGEQCSRRAAQGNRFCKTHGRMVTRTKQEYSEENIEQPNLDKELDNCSCSEICNLVYNSTNHRVSLDPGLPHECLKAQAIEHLRQ